MKLLFGQFTQKQLAQMSEDFREAQHQHAGMMIVPYFGDTQVQVIELSRQRKRRRDVSLYAHRVRP